VRLAHCLSRGVGVQSVRDLIRGVRWRISLEREREEGGRREAHLDADGDAGDGAERGWDFHDLQIVLSDEDEK
jgi:hypothetical protein